MNNLTEILQKSASRHRHLCPRQVLGARMGMLAGELLELELPREDKILLVIAETDGCTVDGLIASTGCHVGGRTLRILDFGKVAATFVNAQTDETVRIVPKPGIRALAGEYAVQAKNKWEAMLLGYQQMPDEVLFKIIQVKLSVSITEILSRAWKRAICEVCEEEIINGREVNHNDMVLCQACVGNPYYQVLEPLLN
jgi:formylmethanofuran dehydrogenase subunit E